MSILRFNDGVNIDTSGPLRPLHLHDGWYVVGEGYFIPVKDRREADEEIANMNKARSMREGSTMPRPRRDGRPPSPPRKQKLTAIAVRTLPAQARQYLVWDLDTRGLVLCIQPSSARSYKFLYSHARKLRWYSLGDADALPLSEARKKARILRVQIDAGLDPQGARIAERGRGTFFELAARYRDEYAKKHNKSWKQADYLVTKHILPRWGALSVTSITRAEVRAAIAKIEAPVVANQTLAAVSAIFSFGVEQEVVSVNPASGIKRNPTKSRERVLSDTEIAQLWAALDEIEPPVATALKLILLTGARPGEILHMRREHLTDGWWEMPGAPSEGWPGTKSGSNHRIWLAQPALELIAKSDANFGGSGLGGPGHLKETS
jgi:hypothetical protein